MQDPERVDVPVARGESANSSLALRVAGRCDSVTEVLSGSSSTPADVPPTSRSRAFLAVAEPATAALLPRHWLPAALQAARPAPPDELQQDSCSQATVAPPTLLRAEVVPLDRPLAHVPAVQGDPADKDASPSAAKAVASSVRADAA